MASPQPSPASRTDPKFPKVACPQCDDPLQPTFTRTLRVGDIKTGSRGPTAHPDEVVAEFRAFCWMCSDTFFYYRRLPVS